MEKVKDGLLFVRINGGAGLYQVHSVEEGYEELREGVQILNITIEKKED